MRRLRLLLAFSALWALPAGASADVLIERVPCPGLPSNRAAGCTGLSAEGGALLWSAYDPATKVYRLTARRAGITASVPVPPRRQPFDADLGRDAHGRLVATYSRCPGDASGPARGCGAYETVLGLAGERRLLTRISASGDACYATRSRRANRVVPTAATATATTLTPRKESGSMPFSIALP
jgi:hypothetical protein